MDPDVDDVWVKACMAPELTEREKALRNRFVDELLVDGHAISAALRVGFQKAFAEDYAVKFMAEPYVQQRIKAVEHSETNQKETDKYDKQSVRAALRKIVNNPATGDSDRIRASRELALILGMHDQPEPVDKNKHRGGVLMVPAIANLDDWEEVAKTSQAKLKADVRH